MAQVNTNLFSNTPFFCQKNLSTSEVLDLPFITSLLLPDAATNFGKCGDPNLGKTTYANYIHTLIRCGGRKIDMNWMEELFPMDNNIMSETKNIYNHYICDPDMNLYVANSASAASAGAAFWVTINKSNHTSDGTTTLAAMNLQFIDKDAGIWYTITDVDASVPFANRIELTPLDGTVVGSVKPNTPYLVGLARFVGGCQGAVDINSVSTIGYSQEVNFLRVRRDWKLCIDLLTGYKDKLQFMITYDMNGYPVDGWDVKEAMDMREGIRQLLNLCGFIGTPTTNAALISGAGATIDSTYTGFYGLLPTMKYGGGNVYDYRSDIGFDWEIDGEPIMLYQDSRKRTSKFMALWGRGFRTRMIDSTNKLVARQVSGQLNWDVYQRMNEDELKKLEIKAFEYMGFEVDGKEVDSWSDYRFLGSDYFSNLAIFLAQDGISENGRPMKPVEFYNQGVGKWTGNYEEFYIDFRKTDRTNDIGGWAAQSLAMAVHCPNQHILVNPVKV